VGNLRKDARIVEKERFDVRGICYLIRKETPAFPEKKHRHSLSCDDKGVARLGGSFRSIETNGDEHLKESSLTLP